MLLSLDNQVGTMGFCFGRSFSFSFFFFCKIRPSYAPPSSILSIFECHVRFSISLKFRIKGDLSIVRVPPSIPLPPPAASFWWHLSKAMLPSRRFFWTKGNQHNIGGLRQNYCLFDGRHTRNIFSCNDDWLIFFQ